MFQRLDLGTVWEMFRTEVKDQSRWKFTSNRSELRRTELAGHHMELKRKQTEGYCEGKLRFGKWLYLGRRLMEMKVFL